MNYNTCKDDKEYILNYLSITYVKSSFLNAGRPIIIVNMLNINNPYGAFVITPSNKQQGHSLLKRIKTCLRI